MVAIEASSTFHRRFIEFFMVINEIFDDRIYFSWKYTFRNLKKINLKWLSSKLHRRFIEKFVHDREKFDEASMNVDEGIFDAMSLRVVFGA